MLHPFDSVEIGFMHGSIDYWAVVVVARLYGIDYVYFARDEWYFSGLRVGASAIGDKRTWCLARQFDMLPALDGSGSTGIIPPTTIAYIWNECVDVYGEWLAAAMFEFWMHVYMGEIAEEHKQWFVGGKLHRTRAGRSHKLYALHRIFHEGVDVKDAANEMRGMSAELPKKMLAKQGIAQITVHSPFLSEYDNHIAYVPVGFDRSDFIAHGAF